MIEIAKDTTIEQVRKLSGADIKISPNLKKMNVD
jgi:acyl CoA:acetate/3-ketoacid CoA transferase beta subunit